MSWPPRRRILRRLRPFVRGLRHSCLPSANTPDLPGRRYSITHHKSDRFITIRRHSGIPPRGWMAHRYGYRPVPFSLSPVRSPAWAAKRGKLRGRGRVPGRRTALCTLCDHFAARYRPVCGAGECAKWARGVHVTSEVRSARRLRGAPLRASRADHADRASYARALPRPIRPGTGPEEHATMLITAPRTPTRPRGRRAPALAPAAYVEISGR